MNTLISIIFALILLQMAFKLFLDSLNIQFSNNILPKTKDLFDEDTIKKSTEYTIEKLKFEKFPLILNLFILFFVLFTPFLLNLYNFFIEMGDNLLNKSLFVFLFSILISIPSIPLEYYQQFKIEEKYGFNKSNIKLWIMDKIKGLVIGAIITIPLLMALISIVTKMGEFWWIYGFVFITFFQVLMMVLYPMLIMPIFNKFSPIQEGELKDKLFSLAQKTNFKTNSIEVMDGSKRSSHSNAFFTGFGGFRKIVLFDTLIEQLNSNQLTAVLAHEIGHYKKGHIPKRLFLSIAILFLTFYLLDYFIQASWFLPAFGFEPGALAPTLILLSLFSSLITFWISPIFNYFSRKNEYEADYFAKEATQSPDDLIDSLKIMTKKNLSNIQPHPLYSFFYYSHPTLFEREAALRQNSSVDKQ